MECKLVVDEEQLQILVNNAVNEIFQNFIREIEDYEAFLEEAYSEK